MRPPLLLLKTAQLLVIALRLISRLFYNHKAILEQPSVLSQVHQVSFPSLHVTCLPSSCPPCQACSCFGNLTPSVPLARNSPGGFTAGNFLLPSLLFPPPFPFLLLHFPLLSLLLSSSSSSFLLLKVVNFF